MKKIFKDMVRAVRGKLTDRGGEILDSVPLAAHLPVRPTPTLEERMKDFVRNQIHLTKQFEGSESFDEADDFSEDEDDEFYSAHELTAAQEAFKLAPMPTTKGTQPPPSPVKKKSRKSQPESSRKAQDQVKNRNLDPDESDESDDIDD